MILYQTGQAQGPKGGNHGSNAYDITVSTGSGNCSTQFELHKFAPGSNLATADRMCAINTGKVALGVEKSVSSCKIYEINYVRNNTFTERSNAGIEWAGFEKFKEDYPCKMKRSNDEYNFLMIYASTYPQGQHNRPVHDIEKNIKWGHFFGIKQGYSNGYARFSEKILGEPGNSDESKINIYPNPSNFVVGIKFVNIFTGKFLIQISNTQGQTVFSKELQTYGVSFKFVATLQRGMYWSRLIEVTSHLSCVNQLLIK